MDNGLLQFQTDYLISWDFSQSDAPCVSLVRLDKDGTRVIGESLGISFEKSGCVSLRQMVEEYEYRKRAEAERKKDLAEFRQKVLAKEGQA